MFKSFAHFNGFFSGLFTNFGEFFIYYENRSFNRCMAIKYFLPVSGLLFFLLTMSFGEVDFTVLMKSNLSICSFMDHAFDVIVKNVCLTQGTMVFS